MPLRSSLRQHVSGCAVKEAAVSKASCSGIGPNTAPQGPNRGRSCSSCVAGAPRFTPSHDMHMTLCVRAIHRPRVTPWDRSIGARRRRSWYSMRLSDFAERIAALLEGRRAKATACRPRHPRAKPRCAVSMRVHSERRSCAAWALLQKICRRSLETSGSPLQRPVNVRCEAYGRPGSAGGMPLGEPE